MTWKHCTDASCWHSDSIYKNLFQMTCVTKMTPQFCFHLQVTCINRHITMYSPRLFSLHSRFPDTTPNPSIKIVLWYFDIFVYLPRFLLHIWKLCTKSADGQALLQRLCIMGSLGFWVFRTSTWFLPILAQRWVTMSEIKMTSGNILKIKTHFTNETDKFKLKINSFSTSSWESIYLSL